MTKVAIVHELLTMRGGAERVTKIFADMFPDAPIFTLLYDEKKLGEWFPTSRIRTSRLQKCATLSANHHLYLPFFPRAVEQWDFSDFDLVISSSSAFVHGIITNGKPKHLCYVHSPARYLWDRTHEIQRETRKKPYGFFAQWYLAFIFHKLRIWDCEASYRPDVLIAASQEVANRIQRYWRKESRVIHPPIDDRWFDEQKKSSDKDEKNLQVPYYLIVSTLARYKRIDLAIEACNVAKKRLVVIGEGMEKKRLQKLAGKTMTFLGYLPHEQMKSWYRNASATIVPGEEDFGLVPLESMACGTPVIAFGRGGVLETIREHETGEFFLKQTSEALIDAMQRTEKNTYDSRKLREHARQFSKQAFEENIYKAIDAMMTEKSPDELGYKQI